MGLQCQINSLKTAADRIGLMINTTKSKVVVCRKGGYIGSKEKWYIGDHVLETTNEYKYLGKLITTKLSTNVALSDLASRGKAAAAQICKSLRKLALVTPDVFFRIFDTKVQPILLYSSEIWGLESCEIIENVHMFALKQFLNVPLRSPNAIVYGDTGRYPLSVGAVMRVVKYWLNLLRMDKDRLPYRVYEMMTQNLHYPNGWACRVKNVLCEHGLESFWMAQSVQDESSFLCRLRECLIQRFKDAWFRQIESSERYAFYKEIKTFWGRESYLYILDKKVFRNVFCRFRFGCTEMSIHRYRYSTDYSRVCKICQEEEEDEYHIMVKCPALDSLRRKYIAPYVPERSDNVTVDLLNSKDTDVIRSVATYLYHVFVWRGDGGDDC